MTKNLLFLFIAFVISFSSKAQQNPCVPDASLQDSLYGLWPDTTENLKLSQVDTYYEEHIQIKTPKTVGEVMGSPYYIENPINSEFLPDSINIAPLEITEIKLVDVSGLPDIMSVYLSNEDSVFEGDAVACVTLYGTPGQNELGQHDITLLIDGEVNVPVYGPTTLYEQLGEYESIEGYRLIVQTEPVSVSENKNLAFAISQNSPNPFNNITSIEYISPNESSYNFTVVNILGEVQYNRVLRATSGVNTIAIDASGFSSGIYFYSLSNLDKILTKKMIVNKN